MESYWDRRADTMRALQEGVQTDPQELRADLQAFRQDLKLYEAYHLDHLAAWARDVIAKLEAKLEGQP